MFKVFTLISYIIHLFLSFFGIMNFKMYASTCNTIVNSMLLCICCILRQARPPVRKDGHQQLLVGTSLPGFRSRFLPWFEEKPLYWLLFVLTLVMCPPWTSQQDHSLLCFPTGRTPFPSCDEGSGSSPLWTTWAGRVEGGREVLPVSAPALLGCDRVYSPEGQGIGSTSGRK